MDPSGEKEIYKMNKRLLFIFVCSILVIGTEAQSISLPKSFDPFTYSVPKGTIFGYSKPYGNIYGFPQFTLWGWSDDGKIAFSITRNIDGRGGTIVSYFIQDLITDETLWKYEDDSFDWEGEYSGPIESVIKMSFERQIQNLESTFSKFRIIQIDTEYKKMPIILNDHTIQSDIEKKLIGKNEIGLSEIEYQIAAKREDGKSKIIKEKAKKTLENIYICGWFMSPYGNRSAIIIAEEEFVFEGTELFYSVIGCNLNIGFK